MSEKITMESVCLPSVDIVAREIEGEMIIVPLVSGIGDADNELYTLNETGKNIWQLLDGQKKLSQVAAILSDRFASPEDEICEDVLGFATEMIRWGMLTVKE